MAIIWKYRVKITNAGDTWYVADDDEFSSVDKAEAGAFAANYLGHVMFNFINNAAAFDAVEVERVDYVEIPG